MMWKFNLIVGKIFGSILFLFQNLDPWIGMIIVSLITGLLMLLIFRYTSNQAGIRKTKNKIKAHLLEMRLFQDSMRVSLRAQGSILLANIKYMSYSLKPLLIMIVPVVLILIQMNFWFGYEVLELGEDTLLKIKLKEELNPLETDIRIEPSPALLFAIPPVRIEEENEIDWRFSVQEAGLHTLQVVIDGKSITKAVSAGQKHLNYVSPIRVQKNFLQELLYPTEAPLEKSLPIQSIEITHSLKSMTVFGFNLHWIIAFFVLSIIFGFSFKGVFGVEI